MIWGAQKDLQLIGIISSPTIEPIHSRVLVIQPNSRSPIWQKGGYPRGGFGVTENWVFLQGFLLMKIKCDGTFGGKYEHHLISEGDSYKIRHKKVTLINCDAPQKTLTVYL